MKNFINKVPPLKKRGEYLLVYEKGRGWHDKLITMKVLANKLEVSRFGFSVGKEVGKAVTRNLIRRRLRGIVHTIQVKPGWDIVIIARREVVKANFTQLKLTVDNLLCRAKLKNGYEAVGLRIN